MLQIDRVTVMRDGKRVLSELTLDVERGEVVCIAAEDGLAKSTLTEALVRVRALTSGDIRVGGVSLAKCEPHQAVAMGLVVVPERRGTIGSLSVRDNLLLGAHGRSERERARAAADVLHTFPILKGRQGQLAATLSGGERQLLAIARALVAKSHFIVLDEPLLGLSDKSTELVIAAIATAQRTAGIVTLEQRAILRHRIEARSFALIDGGLVTSPISRRHQRDDSSESHLADSPEPTRGATPVVTE